MNSIDPLKQQAALDYRRIAAAIEYLSANFKDQPDLESLAATVHVSPFHLQKMFTDWAGISPKKFVKYLTAEYAKSILQQGNATVADAAFEAGLSGPGRLHDLFVSIEAMTPGTFRSGGKGLNIRFSFAPSLFGAVLVASTGLGICHLSFADDDAAALHNLKQRFPMADFREEWDALQEQALALLHGATPVNRLKLHLKGTPFQLKVWEALLRIPPGRLATYGQLAAAAGTEGAPRAAGTAIGCNPVAYLIPCHRVIRSSGITGEYAWGSIRKKAIIAWEGAKNELGNQRTG